LATQIKENVLMVFKFNLLNSSFVIVFHQLNKMGEIIGMPIPKKKLVAQIFQRKM